MPDRAYRLRLIADFKLASLLPGADEDTPPPPPAGSDVTGSTPAPAEPNFAVKDTLLGGDPGDDLTLGKRHYREKNYGLAEQHFRRAAETTPRDGEAWLGLAASYDRLKRYDLADRAYREALAIYGPRAEVVNNIGYSYLLRGDLRRARSKFAKLPQRTRKIQRSRTISRWSTRLPGARV